MKIKKEAFERTIINSEYIGYYTHLLIPQAAIEQSLSIKAENGAKDQKEHYKQLVRGLLDILH